MRPVLFVCDGVFFYRSFAVPPLSCMALTTLSFSSIRSFNSFCLESPRFSQEFDSRGSHAPHFAAAACTDPLLA